MSSIKFSNTERQIIEYYLKGLRPREIAERLGCSIRTVYKATYKYRRWLREKGELEKPHTIPLYRHSALLKEQNGGVNLVLPHFVAIPSAEIYEFINYIKELVNVIKELNYVLSTLKNSIERLQASLDKMEYRPSSYTKVMNADDLRPSIGKNLPPLPSYLKDNPWVEILSRRSEIIASSRG